MRAKWDDDNRIEVRGEVDHTTSGQAWSWKIKHNGSVSAQGRAVARGGDFEVRRSLVDLAGTRPLRLPGRADQDRRGLPGSHRLVSRPRPRVRGVRFVRNPVVQYLAVAVVLFVALSVATSILSARVASTEARADAGLGDQGARPLGRPAGDPQGAGRRRPRGDRQARPRGARAAARGRRTPGEDLAGGRHDPLLRRDPADRRAATRWTRKRPRCSRTAAPRPRSATCPSPRTATRRRTTGWSRSTPGSGRPRASRCCSRSTSPPTTWPNVAPQVFAPFRRITHRRPARRCWSWPPRSSGC